MRELDEIYAVFLAVESSFGIALHAIVNHDRVIVARTDQKLARLRECHRVDLIRVFLKDFRDFEALYRRFRDPHILVSHITVILGRSNGFISRNRSYISHI